MDCVALRLAQLRQLEVDLDFGMLRDVVQDRASSEFGSALLAFPPRIALVVITMYVRLRCLAAPLPNFEQPGLAPGLAVLLLRARRGWHEKRRHGRYSRRRGTGWEGSSPATLGLRAGLGNACMRILAFGCRGGG